MPHSEPSEQGSPLVKRQKLSELSRAPPASIRGSTIFAPFRVSFRQFG